MNLSVVPKLPFGNSRPETLFLQDVKEGKAQAVLLAVDRLAHWQKDADLAGLREAKGLEMLSSEERQAWQKLWAFAAQVLKDAQSRITKTRHDGILSDKITRRGHEFKMLKGNTYILDLESSQFDTFLILEDAAGKKLAENDDIVPGVNLNSRLVFEAPADGLYRIVATSFEQRGAGAYTLTIREFAK